MNDELLDLGMSMRSSSSHMSHQGISLGEKLKKLDCYEMESQIQQRQRNLVKQNSIENA